MERAGCAGGNERAGCLLPVSVADCLQRASTSYTPEGWMRRVSQTAAGVVLFRNGGEARRYLLMRSALTRRSI